jgi:hypothetical protein
MNSLTFGPQASNWRRSSHTCSLEKVAKVSNTSSAVRNTSAPCPVKVACDQCKIKGNRWELGMSPRLQDAASNALLCNPPKGASLLKPLLQKSRHCNSALCHSDAALAIVWKVFDANTARGTAGQFKLPCIATA